MCIRDSYTSGGSDTAPPLREQLHKDPYIQLAVFLIDELALNTTTVGATP